MTQRAYICDIEQYEDDGAVGWWPVIREYQHLWTVPHGHTIWKMTDGRLDITKPGRIGIGETNGACTVECNVPDEVHEVLVADPRFVLLADIDDPLKAADITKSAAALERAGLGARIVGKATAAELVDAVKEAFVARQAAAARKAKGQK